MPVYPGARPGPRFALIHKAEPDGAFSYHEAFDVETCRASSVRGVRGAVPDGEPRRLSRLFSGRRDRQPELDTVPRAAGIPAGRRDAAVPAEQLPPGGPLLFPC